MPSTFRGRFQRELPPLEWFPEDLGPGNPFRWACKTRRTPTVDELKRLCGFCTESFGAGGGPLPDLHAAWASRVVPVCQFSFRSETDRMVFLLACSGGLPSGKSVDSL